MIESRDLTLGRSHVREKKGEDRGSIFMVIGHCGAPITASGRREAFDKERSQLCPNSRSYLRDINSSLTFTKQKSSMTPTDCPQGLEPCRPRALDRTCQPKLLQPLLPSRQLPSTTPHSSPYRPCFSLSTSTSPPLLRSASYLRLCLAVGRPSNILIEEGVR